MVETQLPRGRWWTLLGIDSTFAAVAAAHSILIFALAALMQSDLLSHWATEDLWMIGIGVTATSAPLLAVWAASGPGRLAVRSLWAIAIVHGLWLVIRSLVHPGEGFSEIPYIITEATTLLSATIALITAMAMRLMRGVRVARNDGGEVQGDSHYQFRLADMLLVMVMTAFLLIARERYAAIAPVLYSVGRGLDGSASFAIRCAAFQCAAIGFSGVWLLLGQRCRAALTVGIAFVSTLGAFLLNSLPFQSQIFGDWGITARTFGLVGLVSLLLTLGTLLPLRTRHWRIQRRPSPL